MKLLRTPILNNTCLQLLLNWLYEVIVCNFVSGSHLKPSWVILQKYQLLSNKSFKENLAHMLPIYLTPTFSCGFRFPYTNGAVGRKIVLSFTECLVCVCVFCLFTPFLSVLFVLHRKNLVLYHLINRCDFYKWTIFEKKRHYGK